MASPSIDWIRAKASFKHGILSLNAREGKGVVKLRMGSYYDFRVGGYSVVSTKWPIDGTLLSLFVEADKVCSHLAPDLPSPCAHVHENDEFIGYCSTAQAIADRLDIMGFTPKATKTDFSSYVNGEIESEQSREEWLRETSEETQTLLQRRSNEILGFLPELNFERWIAAIKKLKTEGLRWLDGGRLSRKLDLIEAHILDRNSELFLGFGCSDLRFLVRAFLMCAEPDEPVVLDCTDIIQAGYINARDSITIEARLEITGGARAVEKILLLTEGCSDTRILQATFEVLHPHLREFLSFLDHDSFSVPGGAGNLLNLLRGFAGAGVSNRVLALFDNDTAGSVQFAKAQTMTLPQNFKVQQLPYLPFADQYPTLGPAGLSNMNINGSACSIELYLGRSSLMDQSGVLVPVQWTGFERSLSRYQGELIDKAGVQERYLDALRRGIADTTDMKQVFGQILSAFHN